MGLYVFLLIRWFYTTRISHSAEGGGFRLLQFLNRCHFEQTTYMYKILHLVTLWGQILLVLDFFLYSLVGGLCIFYSYVNAVEM